MSTHFTSAMAVAVFSNTELPSKEWQACKWSLWESTKVISGPISRDTIENVFKRDQNDQGNTY